MSTFYVLPSRPLLGQVFAEFLGNFFPRLAWPRDEWRDLAETLTAHLLRHTDCFLVYREDLPDGVPLSETLVRDYGAALADEVVEVSLGSRSAGLTTQHWRLWDGPAAAA